MNPVHYQSAPPPLRPWFPMLPPDPPGSSKFWDRMIVCNQLKELRDSVNLAKAMEKELEVLMMVKDGIRCPYDEGKGSIVPFVSEFSKYQEERNMDLESQELVSVEAANSLISQLSAQLEPFRAVINESSPWEEKSAVVRLAGKMKKYERNKLWRKRKRKRVAEMHAKEHERFEEADREADEWRARESAKDIAKRKIEEMKEIEKAKAKRMRKGLNAELELALIKEELQKLRSIRIEKLKKRGHFIPEEDDKFFERVQAAVEAEDAAKNVSAEDSKTGTQTEVVVSKDTAVSNQDISENKDKEDPSMASKKESDKKGPEGQSYTGASDNVANLPFEFYHYYYGSYYNMARLIEVRREWDAYIRPGGSRIPGHWVQPPPPADEIWASYLVKPQ